MRPALALALLAFILPVQGEQKRAQSAGNQEQVHSVKQSALPSLQVIAIHEQRSKDQGDSTQRDTDTYFHRLLRADNLPNLLLFFVGICGIGVGICTLRQIRTQTKLLGQYVEATKNSVIAAQNSTEAMLKSVRLQEVALAQWVDIENWKALPWIPEGGTLSLHIQFDVINPTNLPLTFESVLIQIGDQGNKIDRKNMIPPKGSKPVVTAVTITESQALKWEDLKELTFMIGGYVQFVDVLDKTQVQPFSGLIACSKKGGVRFIPPYGSGLYITGEEKNSGDPN